VPFAILLKIFAQIIQNVFSFFLQQKNSGGGLYWFPIEISLRKNKVSFKIYIFQKYVFLFPRMFKNKKSKNLLFASFSHVT